MSFTDLLRQSRSKPVTALHKFLTNYDPNNQRRVYAFVEGNPDKAFYRRHITGYVTNISDIFIYNCEGKQAVYEAFSDVMKRFPGCRRVLFFVDKDLDDILGSALALDPRIFTTDYYSIENYLVKREVLERYFADYVKIRRVEIDFNHLLAEFDRELDVFYKICRPIMAWILVMRRSGHRVLLTNVDMEYFCSCSGESTRRRCHQNSLSYLNRVSQVPRVQGVWRNIRSTSRELQRLEPKRYVRGKFEAWWFVEFVKRAIDRLAQVTKEAGGSVAVSVALNEGNFVQLLASAVSTPPSLASFLDFHLRDGMRTDIADSPRSSLVDLLSRFLRKR